MRRLAWLLGTGMVLLLMAGSPVAAADTETRDFTVFIDGRNAGTYQMRITRQDDGTRVMLGQADVHIRYLLVYNYTYQYRGTEVWKDGRLRSLNSQANDNGKTFNVQASGQADVLNLTVNGQERRLRPDVWTSTYWCLPEAKYRPDAQYRNKAIPLLDADTGRSADDGVLQYIGREHMNVTGQVQDCTHYKVWGLNPTDLWYDSQERPVRQEWIEDGHRVVWELTRISR
jgi:hypothetical protein